MKPFFSLFLLFLITSFSYQESNIEGLKITFKKVNDDYVPAELVSPPGSPGPNYTVPIEANEGMKFVKLKLVLTNEGEKNCVFDFKDVYISTQQDTLYSFYRFDGFNPFVETKTTLKPNKELKRSLLFEFPANAKPKELFIEDKRFKIIEN